jgi:alpha-tubulin suppressor-like RCC1 family protein
MLIETASDGTTAYQITDSSKPEVAISSSQPVKSTIAGYSHTCAISLDDKAYCWGRNFYGQLGDNTTNNSSIPVAVKMDGVLNGKTIKLISLARDHTCAVASDDKAYCWGVDDLGQLGNNSTTNSSVPVAVNTTGLLSGKTIKSISVSAGGWHTCVLASNDQVYCWGYNSSGQLGNNSTTNSSVPVAVNTAGVLSGKTIKSISSGSDSVCAVASDDLAYCWGDNGNGQLGNNSTTDSSVPVAVNTAGVLSGKTIRSISSGSTHTCVLASDDRVYCWGRNSYGELGNNSTTDSSVPVAVNTAGVLSGKTIKAVSTSGYLHTCVVASDDQAYCWGRNGYGQLGNNSTIDSSIPVAVDITGLLNGKTIRLISSGNDHTCVTTYDNKSYCWGYNGSGRLGNNSTANSSVPVAVDTSGL